MAEGPGSTPSVWTPPERSSDRSSTSTPYTTGFQGRPRVPAPAITGAIPESSPSSGSPTDRTDSDFAVLAQHFPSRTAGATASSCRSTTCTPRDSRGLPPSRRSLTGSSSPPGRATATTARTSASPRVSPASPASRAQPVDHQHFGGPRGQLHLNDVLEVGEGVDAGALLPQLDSGRHHPVRKGLKFPRSGRPDLHDRRSVRRLGDDRRLRRQRRLLPGWRQLLPVRAPRDASARPAPRHRLRRDAFR